MKNILVTGTTGFIGQYFIQFLLKKDCKIRALIRSKEKISLLPANVEIVLGDLTQPESLMGACDGIDTVFHLGGYAHAWEEANSNFAEQHHKINFQGTQNLLNEALKSQVSRFIFFSSVKAVADCDNAIDENHTAEPTSPYGIAKRQAEKIVLAAKDQGMQTCVLRPSLVYGPEWKGNLASMLRAIDKGVFPPLPPTQNVRSMVSVHDICQAAWLAAENPQANGKIYFVTDGVSYSTRDLYIQMCQALGKKIPRWYVPFAFFKLLAVTGDLGKKILRRRLPFNSDALAKIFGSAHYKSDRIRQELSFKPFYNLKTMLPLIIEHHRNQKQHGG